MVSGGAQITGGKRDGSILVQVHDESFVAAARYRLPGAR